MTQTQIIKRHIQERKALRELVNDLLACIAVCILTIGSVLFLPLIAG